MKTADGVELEPGMKVWFMDGGKFYAGIVQQVPPCRGEYADIALADGGEYQIGPGRVFAREAAALKLYIARLQRDIERGHKMLDDASAKQVVAWNRIAELEREEGKP